MPCKDLLLLAICRGQGKRKYPVVQTLLETDLTDPLKPTSIGIGDNVAEFQIPAQDILQRNKKTVHRKCSIKNGENIIITIIIVFRTPRVVHSLFGR